MDVYDKIRAVGEEEGWTEGTQLILICSFIECFTQKWLLDEFLETRRGAS